jgi:hypothetical protein
MSKINYELRKKIATDEIVDMVFEDSSVKHKLQEFYKEILKKIRVKMV